MRLKGKARAVRSICASSLVMALAGWVSLMMAATRAGAEFYQFTFGGVVDTVDGIVPAPWEDVHVGSEFEFSYIFDSEAEDHASMSWLGLYYLESGVVTIEGAGQTTLDGEIRILNLAHDDYYASLRGLPIGADAGIHLSSADSLDSDILLLDVNLDDWDDELFEVVGSGFQVAGHVTAFNGQIVPGPGAIWLLGYALFKFRRRRPGLDKHI